MTAEEKLAKLREIINSYQLAHGGFPSPEAAQLADEILQVLNDRPA